jgi:hypothetical protein
VPYEATSTAIDRDRRELASSSAEGAGIVSVSEGIPNPMSARMSFLLRRAPYAQFLTLNEEMMGRISHA